MRILRERLGRNAPTAQTSRSLLAPLLRLPPAARRLPSLSLAALLALTLCGAPESVAAQEKRRDQNLNAAAFGKLMRRALKAPRRATPSLASLRRRAQETPVMQTSLGGFSFHLPGDLKKGTGPRGRDVGALDDAVHAPWIRFPIEDGPAYVNSQVWGWGGLLGEGGGECDARNYSYPWRDNFCESRSWVSGACPAGIGHQGVDIRPATCRNNHHWAVAAEDGRVTRIGGYGVTLMGESGYEYRYLHVNTRRAAVKRGQAVRAGDRIALISNFYGGTPTSIHLHFEMRRPDSDGGLELVSPYATLIPAYMKLIAGSEAEAAAAMAAIGGPADFAGFQECEDCPRMVGVPGGEAVIGSPASEPGRQADEGPQRTLTLRRFAIGETEITRRQWTACVEDGFCAPPRAGMAWPEQDQPVTGVSRADVTGEGVAEKGFIAWVNAKAAAAGVEGAPYRLPSEAEWEHAYRAGAATAFHSGARITPDLANFDARFETGFPAEIRARTGPVAAGALPANRWNVHEMAGNVWEWTADCHSADHATAPVDGSPRGAPGCPDGVIRGGSLFSFADQLRAANRRPMPANRAEPDVGFRLARSF